MTRLLNADENTLIVEALNSKGTKATLPKHVLRRLLRNYHMEIDKGHDERKVRRLLLCGMACNEHTQGDNVSFLRTIERRFFKQLPVSYLVNEYEAARKKVASSLALAKGLYDQCTPREKALLSKGKFPRRLFPVMEEWMKHP